MKLTQPNLIRYTRPQRLAIFLLLTMIIGVEVFGYVVMHDEPEAKPVKIPAEVLALQPEIDSRPRSTGQPKSIKIEKFDPNKLNSQQWEELGFSNKQVQTIFKYKKLLGGNFSSKKQIQNCYVISPEKFAELEPYIVFSSDNSQKTEFKRPGYNKEPKINYRKFNPNDYTQKDWENIGFSTRQAQTILKYKRSLGGEFSSLDEIKKCYVISEGKFNEMKSYMILVSPEEFEEGPNEPEASMPPITKFNPNHLTREGWADLGFTEKQINTIFNYKNSLGGEFKNAETLRRCYSISAEKFAEIEPYLDFNMN